MFTNHQNGEVVTYTYDNLKKIYFFNGSKTKKTHKTHENATKLYKNATKKVYLAG